MFQSLRINVPILDQLHLSPLEDQEKNYSFRADKQTVRARQLRGSEVALIICIALLFVYCNFMAYNQEFSPSQLPLPGGRCIKMVMHRSLNKCSV